MKKNLLMAFAIAASFIFAGCSSSQKALSWVDPSGYLSGDDASANAIVAPTTTPTYSTTPTQTTTTTATRATANEAEAIKVIKGDAQTKSENVEVVVGDASNLKNYNVCVGVFSKIENAKSYYERMAGRGFTPLVVMNPAGLYRVIAFSSDSAAETVSQRDYIRTNYASDGTNLCDRAWILIANK